MFTRPGSFAVLLPVKSPGTGKSRLSALRDSDRARLAAAFATDVVDACLSTDGVAGVLVVSDDAAFAATLATSPAQYRRAFARRACLDMLPARWENAGPTDQAGGHL